MEERRLIAMIILIDILVAVLGVGLIHSILESMSYPIDVLPVLETLDKAIVTRFDARISNGTTLDMELTYRINKKGLSMLYYTFNSPLRVESPASPGEIFVRGIACPQGMYYYVVDADGNLYTDLPGAKKNDLSYKLEVADAENEIGCYSPTGLSPGEFYTVRYVLVLVPPKIYEDSNNWLYYLDLVGSEEHLRTQNMTIIGEYDTRIAVLPPLGSGKPSDRYSLPVLSKGTGVRLAIISNNSARPETSTIRVDSVYHVLDNEVTKRTLYGRIGLIFLIVPIVMAMVSPAVIYMLYNVYGREQPPVDAIPYGFPPRTGEKPWVVAARYGPSPGKITYNVVATILLDLYNRRIIKIDKNGKIVLLSRKNLDPVEDLVVKAVLSGKKTAGELLLDVSDIIKKRAEEAIEGEYKRVLYLLIGIGVASSMTGLAIYSKLLEAPPAGLFLVGILLSILAYAPSFLAPRYLLGRWKPGYRERAIAWHNFAQKIGKIYRSKALTLTELAPYIAALSSPRRAKRILLDLGIDSLVIREIYRVSRRLVWRYRLLSSASGRGGGGYGGGGPGAR